MEMFAFSMLTTQIHPLLTNDVINVLKNQQITTVNSFIQQDPLSLSKLTKLQFKTILIIRKHIFNKYAAKPLNGLEYYKDILKKTAIISTNHLSLDSILDGGFYTGTIYEFSVRSPQHFTKFIYKFMIQFLAKHENKQIIRYYDTKYSLNSLQLKYICDNNYGPGNEMEILQNLQVGQVENITELICALHELKDELEGRLSNKTKLRIVLVDSLTTILYSSIRIEEHNMMLNALINIMRLIAVEYHICFVIGNLLTVGQGYDDNDIKGGKVYGGKYWQSLTNVRLRLLRAKENECDWDIADCKDNFVGTNQFEVSIENDKIDNVVKNCLIEL